MKKRILLLLLMLALAGCGGGGTPTPTPAPTQAPTPAPTATPAPVQVEITMDNWQDYFEIVYREFPVKNELDEVLDFTAEFSLMLKDEYARKNELSIFNSDLAVEFRYSTKWFYVEPDWESGTLTVLEEEDGEPPRELTGTFTVDDNDEVFICTGSFLETEDQRYIKIMPLNPEITRVKGSITIFE